MARAGRKSGARALSVWVNGILAAAQPNLRDGTAYYAFDRGIVRGLVLDTVNQNGGADGSLDDAQLQWLERQLIADYERVIDELLSNNETYAEAFDKGDLPMPPSKPVAVVACMDARLHIPAMLGVEEGDVHVVRNAGGVPDDSVVADAQAAREWILAQPFSNGKVGVIGTCSGV